MAAKTGQQVIGHDVIDVDAIDEEVPETPPSSQQTATTPAVDSSTGDLTDPNPDVHALFAHYNAKYFNSMLNNVYVEFSRRMTLCAGTCTYRGPVAGSRIALSEPLLKFRPASDLKSTLLHEMIHAFNFNRGISRDGPDGHGPEFMAIADRINKCEPPSIRITPYHTFNDEVDFYRTHHWKCEKCDMLIKRSMNRAPGPHDLFWAKHSSKCGGSFQKIQEPTKKPKLQRTNALPVPKRRAVAVKSGTPVQAMQSIPPGVMRTRPIDDMLASSSRRPKTTVPCPICDKKVPVQTLNSHLDDCVSKDLDSDVVEVTLLTNNPPKSPPKTSTDMQQEAQSSECLIDFARNPDTLNFEKERNDIDVNHSGQNAMELWNNQTTDLSEVLRPLTGNQQAIDHELLAKHRLGKQTSSTSAEFSIVNISRRLGISNHEILNILAKGKPWHCDGSILIPEDIDCALTGKQCNGQFETYCESNDKTRPSHFPHTDEQKEVKVDVCEVTPMEDVGRCPLCDVSVKRSLLEAHVNECLDNTGIMKEFSGPCINPGASEHVEAQPQSSTSLALPPTSMTSICPICSADISRRRLESHVSECMASAGLTDAF